MMSRRFKWKLFLLNFFSFLNKTYGTNCGHQSKHKVHIEAFGGHTITQIPFTEDGMLEACGDCLKKMAIQCAWCGNVIFIGNTVTVFPANADQKIPSYAVKHDHGYVGCTRSTCFEQLDEPGKYWAPPGKVEKYKTALEKFMEEERAEDRDKISFA